MWESEPSAEGNTVRRSLTTTATLLCLAMGLSACTGGDGSPEADGSTTSSTGSISTEPSTGPSGSGDDASPSPTTHVATADDGSGDDGNGTAPTEPTPQGSPSTTPLLGQAGPEEEELRPATTLPAGRTTTVRTVGVKVPRGEGVYVAVACGGTGRVTIDDGLGDPTHLECSSPAHGSRATHVMDPGSSVRVTVDPGARAAYRLYRVVAPPTLEPDALVSVSGEGGGDAFVAEVAPGRRMHVTVRCDGDGTLALRAQGRGGSPLGAPQRFVCDGTKRRAVVEAPRRFTFLEVAPTSGVGRYEVAVTRVAR